MPYGGFFARGQATFVPEPQRVMGSFATGMCTEWCETKPLDSFGRGQEVLPHIGVRTRGDFATGMRYERRRCRR